MTAANLLAQDTPSLGKEKAAPKDRRENLYAGRLAKWQIQVSKLPPPFDCRPVVSCGRFEFRSKQAQVLPAAAYADLGCPFLHWLVPIHAFVPVPAGPLALIATVFRARTYAKVCARIVEAVMVYMVYISARAPAQAEYLSVHAQESPFLSGLTLDISLTAGGIDDTGSYVRVPLPLTQPLVILVVHEGDKHTGKRYRSNHAAPVPSV